MNRIRIRTKIALATVAVGLVALLASGLIGFETGKTALEQASFERLTAVREMKASRIEAYFAQIRSQVITMSDNRMVIDAMGQLRAAFHTSQEVDPADAQYVAATLELRGYYEKEFLPRLNPNLQVPTVVDTYWPADPDSHRWQHLYLATNPNATGEKKRLDNAGDGSEYSRVHALFHPVLRGFLERFGYYDIFLIDPKTGHIVYSVFKEVDYATSLKTGAYRETGLAKAARAAMDASAADFARMEDYAPYPPSYNAHASFIASPIFDGGELIGVLAFQMPVARIDDIMTNNRGWTEVGLGSSGETYIVGDDFTIRNQSRFFIEDQANYLRSMEERGLPRATIDKMATLETVIGLQDVRSEGAAAALQGETGAKIFPDYRGVSVLSAYKPLRIPDVHWAIMSEIDEEEAFSGVRAFGTNVLLTALVLILLFVVVSVLVSGTLTKPLRSLTANAREIERGNLDVDVTVAGEDEIGELGHTLSAMKTSIKGLVGKLEESNATLEARVTERTAEVERAHERIRSILENASDAVVVTDEAQTITLFNPRAEEAFGYRAEEVIGRQLNTLVPEESREDHYEMMKRFPSSGATSREMKGRRVMGRRKDGSRFPAEAGISTALIGDEAFFTAFLRDITERTRIEAELQNAFETIKTQKERMENELNVAREIQMSMLPLIFPAFPDRKEFEIYSTLRPAREVGGDFYDFFFIDDRRFCFCVGDVSDKGVPAALFMAVTKTLIKSRAMDDNSPASVLTHVNDELSRENDSSMFVTVFLSFLDLETRELTYTNAGHNPAYIRRENNTMVRLDERHGPVVAAMEGTTYGETSLNVFPGDTILLYTDGVTEAMNSSRELYGEDRLVELFNACDVSTSDAVVKALESSVHTFEAGAEQADDVTILAMRFLEPLHASRDKAALALRVENRIEKIDLVNQEVTRYVEELGIDVHVRRQLNIVFDELLNNIVSYAYEDDAEHFIDISVASTRDRLVITISDEGIPFNAFSVKAPDTDLPLEDRAEGGLGIHLVRNLMDEVNYQRAIGRNTITLVKLLGAPTA